MYNSIHSTGGINLIGYTVCYGCVHTVYIHMKGLAVRESVYYLTDLIGNLRLITFSHQRLFQKMQYSGGYSIGGIEITGKMRQSFSWLEKFQ